MLREGLYLFQIFRGQQIFATLISMDPEETSNSSKIPTESVNTPSNLTTQEEGVPGTNVQGNINSEHFEKLAAKKFKKDQKNSPFKKKQKLELIQKRKVSYSVHLQLIKEVQVMVEWRKYDYQQQDQNLEDFTKKCSLQQWKSIRKQWRKVFSKNYNTVQNAKSIFGSEQKNQIFSKFEPISIWKLLLMEQVDERSQLIKDTVMKVATWRQITEQKNLKNLWVPRKKQQIQEIENHSRFIKDKYSKNMTIFDIHIQLLYFHFCEFNRLTRAFIEVNSDFRPNMSEFSELRIQLNELLKKKVYQSKQLTEGQQDYFEMLAAYNYSESQLQFKVAMEYITIKLLMSNCPIFPNIDDLKKIDRGNYQEIIQKVPNSPKLSYLLVISFYIRKLKKFLKNGHRFLSTYQEQTSDQDENRQIKLFLLNLVRLLSDLLKQQIQNQKKLKQISEEYLGSKFEQKPRPAHYEPNLRTSLRRPKEKAPQTNEIIEHQKEQKELAKEFQAMMMMLNKKKN